MKKFSRIVLFILLCLGSRILPTQAQNNTRGFFIRYHPVDKDSSFVLEKLKLVDQTEHPEEAYRYIENLVALLSMKGYPLASVDSVWETENNIHVLLYVGEIYSSIYIKPSGIEPLVLEKIGFRSDASGGQNIKFSALESLQERLLDHYEQTGYPFAKVYLDSVNLLDGKYFALLKSDKGILYHIDSIRIVGNLKLKSKFLQRYLHIPDGSIYRKQNLNEVDKRMSELPYVQLLQPTDLSMLGSGSVLNIYANQKKSSRVNFLIGFLPNANESGKLQLSGDVNLDLKNLFQGGESILFKWQQLQPKSPRLNLGFSQPYILNSDFGFNFLFDLFKKDSSFLQINAMVGTDFSFSGSKKGSVFVELQHTGLLAGGVDTQQVKLTKKLPANMDLQAFDVGLQYVWNHTNYRLNPLKGTEIDVKASVGTKRIKMNQSIIRIQDNSFDYRQLYDSIQTKSYQVKLQTQSAYYIKLGKSSTLKSGLQAGYYHSPNIFRNELFQIGGYKTLRGFDEESIYASRYAVMTLEYRQLISLNSYLFAFLDQGFVRSSWEQSDLRNNYTGAGLRIFFETGAGLINLSFAAGKRSDVKLNLRQAAKIHFGYINYF